MTHASGVCAGMSQPTTTNHHQLPSPMPNYHLSWPEVSAHVHALASRVSLKIALRQCRTYLTGLATLYTLHSVMYNVVVVQTQVVPKPQYDTLSAAGGGHDTNAQATVGDSACGGKSVRQRQTGSCKTGRTLRADQRRGRAGLDQCV
ncbi:hypothetical protein Vretifemale_12054 [Volvox reticuliferus]|uniref:Uncharacterized protein n=1 Tax=Volvox reticuliferus TaxID=1737510 RepID=A0A8J4CK68_9CHLO|nr:hypothetical protein Vretifemale_12054 [Volvox reticuliferus]